MVSTLFLIIINPTESRKYGEKNSFRQVVRDYPRYQYGLESDSNE